MAAYRDHPGRTKFLDTSAEARDLLDHQLETTASLGRRIRPWGQVERGGQERHVAPLPSQRGWGRRSGRGISRSGGRRRGGHDVTGEPRGPCALGEQTMPLEPVAQRVPRDAEASGRPGQVSAGLFQRRHEPLALDRPHGLLEWTRGGRAACGPVRGGEAETLGGHLRAVAQKRHALHDVGQLADVPGPGIGQQGLARIRGHQLGGPAVVGAGPRQEMIGQQENVRAALPQRWQAQGEHGQPVVKVLAQAPAQ